MRYLRQTLLIMLLIVGAGASVAHAGFSITIGKGDSYVSVGDYDYLPYGGYDRLPRVSFYDVMGDYGAWVWISPFGRVWRPYVYYEWQPYTYGHWAFTRFGPTWVGYEPWAWVAYHYGNWILSREYGWVWLPGYDWHPGRVIWSHSYNTIGWMPAPPAGYNYFCGYLCPERYTYGGGYNDPYRGSYGSNYPYQGSQGYGYEDYNSYEDYNEYEDYSDYDSRDYNSGYDRYGYGNYPYGCGNYGSYGFRYDPYFFNPAYMRIAPRLWVFIPVSNYGYDNYADVYFGSNYVQYLFDRRLVQFNRRGLDRYGLEQIVRQRVVEQPVQIRTMETDQKQVQVVVPLQEQQKIRAHANQVVKEVIAPAFVEKQKSFKAQNAKNKELAARVFQQDERKAPQVETMSEQTVLNEAKKSQEKRHAQRIEVEKRGLESIQKADREGKLEDLKKSNKKAEQQEQEDQKRNAPDKSSREEPQKFDDWKKRETAKFQDWKERQVKEFENWKKSHKNDAEVRRAEADFKDRIKKAEDRLNGRIRHAEEQERKDNR